MPADALAAEPGADTGDRRGRAYLRFAVAEKLAVLAEIAATMRDAGVSTESLVQRGAMPDGSVTFATAPPDGPDSRVHAALDTPRSSPRLPGRPAWDPVRGTIQLA